jgi:type I restriction enzyme S subunit
MAEKVEFYKETEFRDTGIGRIPKEWELIKLSDIAEDIYYGITAKSVENETGLKMLRTSDIKDYTVDWGSLPFCEVTKKRGDIRRFLLRKRDLIIARAGTTGVSVLVEKDFENVFFGSYLIKVKLSPQVHAKFMHYFCQSHFYWDHITSSQAGSTLKNISLPILKSLKVPLPSSIEEQQKIAEILSIVDEAIQKTDEVIAKTERLKKGLMQELLTRGIGHKEFKDTEIGRIPKDWEVVKIGDIAQTSSGGTPNRAKKEYYNGNIPWVKSSELKDNIIYDTEEKITEEGLQNSSAKILPKGTLFVAMYGATVGKTGILGIDAAMNQAICAIPPNKTFDLNFLKNYIIFGRDRLISISSGGAQPNISQEIIRAFKIPLPSLQEQQRIAEILSTIDEKLETSKLEKARLERIKQWFMRELLSGRIRVRVA